MFTGALVVGATGLFGPTPALAADHYDMLESDDALSTQAERGHDIVDVFAFSSPDRQGKLVMVLNTNPRAHADTLFSNVIQHSLRVRVGKTRGAGREYRFTCTFDVPAPRMPQKATCVAYRIVGGVATPVANGSTVVTVNDTSGGDNRQLRAFAGVRADAFFGDGLGLVAMVKTHTLLFGVPPLPEHVRNQTYNYNVLSVVLEVDTKAFLGETDTIFRVAGETALKRRSP